MQELSLNILDITQNSVRAGASLITIQVVEDPEQDLLVITIGDNGCGMSPQQVQRVQDPFYTTRTTRPIGLGVPFFKMAAEMSGGTFTIHSQKGRSTMIIVTFVRSSIDRMPLGNVSATVAALIQGNPNINFIYTRVFGNKKLILNTRELREILGEVSLDTPKVSVFIQEYLEGHTTALQSG